LLLCPIGHSTSPHCEDYILNPFQPRDLAVTLRDLPHYFAHPPTSFTSISLASGDCLNVFAPFYCIASAYIPPTNVSPKMHYLCQADTHHLMTQAEHGSGQPPSSNAGNCPVLYHEHSAAHPEHAVSSPLPHLSHNFESFPTSHSSPASLRQ
jgi:hypothetical protein